MRIFVLFFTLTFYSFSKPLVTENYKYYDIYPIDIHNLERSMDETSPIDILGNVRHGTVNWQIKYYYKRERKSGRCFISQTKTEVKITYYVPRLAVNYIAPEGTRSVFQRYYKILKDYLDKNANFAIDAANEIENELVKIKPINNDCDIIKKDVKNVASDIITKYKNKNKDYEIRTYEGFLDSVRSEKIF